MTADSQAGEFVMSPSTPIRRVAARALCAVLAFAMSFAPVTAAYGANTPLADVPIAAKVTAKPNIFYTLDDSGSMQYNFLPDYVVNAGANISVTVARLAGGPPYKARATGALNALGKGDWINIIGAAQSEYNGFVQITDKPSATTADYVLPSNPAVSPATIAPGFSAIQVVTSAAYCRSGSGTLTCTQQPVAINSSGNVVITGSTITRPGPLTTGGLVTATLTNTAANLAFINTGDSILITNSTTAATTPGTTSDRYYGTFTVTKISSTQLTYEINAVASSTPLSAGGNKYIAFGGSSNFAPPPMHAADFNRLAYNPAVTYYAPKKADGNYLANTPNTDASGNYAYNSLKWASPSVDRDPFNAFETKAGVTPMSTAKDNLSIRVQVPLYCNTDWPLLENDTNWPTGPNGASVLDAGDANGQPQATKGAWCRINGTNYESSAISGAPATAVATVEMGYNYPWRSSSGANGPQYFWQVLSVKTLWCDRTSPYWPRNGNIVNCTAGGVPTCGGGPCPITPEKCNAPAAQCNPTPSLRNFNPAACDSSPLYCLPNVNGSDSTSPGTGTAPECIPCTCKNDYTASTGKCSLNTGNNCSPPPAYGVVRPVGDPQCPGRPQTPDGCSAGVPIYGGPAGSASCTSFMWDPVAGVYSNNPLSSMYPGRTLLDDAGKPAAGAANTSGAPGTTCRHNNYTYAVGGAAGLFKYSASAPAYPGEGAGTAHKFDTAVTNGCPAVGTVVQIPRHYYVIDKVEFCDNRNVTPDAQWRGFGAGTCVENNDLQRYKEARFGKFVRVDLFPSNTRQFAGTTAFPYSGAVYPGGRAWLAPPPAGPDNSESINYANWYAYYSTRLNAAKSTTATAFSFLTPQPGEPVGYRVGFHNLGEEPLTYGGNGTPIIWLDVKEWDPTVTAPNHIDNWYDKLFGIAVTNYKTATLDAMMRIGNIVEKGTGGPAGLPASINPLPATASDPIPKKPDNEFVSCTNNYHILFTDGKTNQVTPITTPGDQDQDIPMSLSFGAGEPIQPTGNYQLWTLQNKIGAGQPWPAPFKQGVQVSDTLADVATYYWARDLRPTVKNDVPSATSEKYTPPPPAAPVPTSNDADPRNGDVAWWQHVNFNAISFGAEGTLDASGLAAQNATLDAIIAGTKQWPDLNTPNNPIYPKGAAAGAVAVDDLWHATVMGHGSFVFARSPIEVSYGIASILSGIQNQQKSRAAAAFGGQVLSGANNIIFVPTVEPGWAGDLIKIQIKPADGSEVTRWWKASQTLRDQINPDLICPAVPPALPACEPWMEPAHRRIVTLTGATGPGVPFQYGSISGFQLTSLGATAAEQQKAIAYLRGGKTMSNVPIEGIGIGQYRKRYGVMGDISNAQPVVVFPPLRPYTDDTDPGYEDYKVSHADRSPRVVAAANDGMVHVFDTGPMPQVGGSGAGGGREVFAFMPRALFKGAGNAAGIQALTYQDGGVPIYKHHMYVDSSPRVADVHDGTGWRTIVVGGLGKGGNSYYALDLTNADAADETQAAAKVMWEWSNTEVKYSYGRPVIVKVRDSAYPYGRWVVIVTGGYDNASGKGKIFFLDAITGAEIGPGVTTSVGTPPGAGQAAGLAQIHAFVKAQHNQIAEQIYGADLLGNLWRVDVSGVNQYKSATAVLFATLDDGTNPQPVTTAPQIEIDIKNGVDRYVFIGTGRLLDPSDLTTPSPAQTQTMYAIRDGTIDAFSTTGLPLRARTFTKPISADGISAIAGGAPNGWRHDLPNNPAPGGITERIVVDPAAAVNIAAYAGTRVQDDPCIIALPASLYGRDYTTGESLLKDDSDGPNDPPRASLLFTEGIVGIDIVGKIQDDGTQVVGIVTSQEVPGARPVQVVNKFRGVGNRISWKLLGGQ
jgi:Tfp pilus tip-associated adhesin PilY1